MCTSVFVVSLLFAGTVFGDDQNQAKIRYYHGSMDNFTELDLGEAEKILQTSWYDPGKTTVMFTHGFTGHPEGPAVKAVITAYLEQGLSNVALLNWEKLAAMALPGFVNSFLSWASPNAIQVGADFAETLLSLSKAGLDLNSTHFIGHSLGAHVFGVAGNKILEKGVQLPWITGLDPATAFDMKPAFLRLTSTSARYVDVIHTDPNKYGSKRELGDVDFWPNFKAFGPVLQPGCLGGNQKRFSQEDLCSHNRSWLLLIDALKNRGTLLGSHARSFRHWKKYTKQEREATVLEIGVFYEDPVPGNYFFSTAAESPYGLTKEGL